MHKLRLHAAEPGRKIGNAAEFGWCKMRKSVVAGSVVALSAAALLLPAVTAHASGTVVTITIAAGSLSISEPAAATLALSGAVYTGSIGNVQVTDDRGNLVASWTAKAAMTDFINGAQTVAATNVSYAPGLASIVSGLPVVIPLPIGSMSSSPQTAATATAVGKNAAKWNPTLSVASNLFTVSGSYTATLTHSVA